MVICYLIPQSLLIFYSTINSISINENYIFEECTFHVLSNVTYTPSQLVNELEK